MLKNSDFCSLELLLSPNGSMSMFDYACGELKHSSYFGVFGT